MPILKYQEFLPHAALRDAVKQIWVLEKAYTAGDDLEEVLPDACVELILNFGSPYRRFDGPAPCELSSVCLVGLLTKPLLLRADGVVKLIAVRFFAWGVLPFLTIKAQRDGTTCVELDSAWRHMFTNVSAKVHRGAYQDAVEEIEDFLIGRRLVATCDRQQVQAAAKLLSYTKGQFRVADLANYCHLSVRQLQRQFEDAMGISPKLLARTIRFESVRNRLMFDPDAALTDLAHEFGYVDQAHFINDFKAFTDKTPGMFAEEMRHLQAVLRDGAHVAFLPTPQSMSDYLGE